MSKTILLGNLGVLDYNNVIYEYNGIKIEDKFASLAVLKLIRELNKKNSRVYPLPDSLVVFTTSKACELNYKDCWKKDRITDEKFFHVGLENTLNEYIKANELDLDFSNKEIKSQESAKDIFDNFITFIENLEEGDKVYIDITNSFRSVPIILLSAIERAKTVHNIDVLGIFYGTFNNIKNQNEHIIDLSNFQKFNEWSYQIRQFIKTGYFSTYTSPKIIESSQLNRDIQWHLSSFSNSIYQPNRLSALEHALEIKALIAKINMEHIQTPNQFQSLTIVLENYFKDFAFINEPNNYIYNIALISKMCFEFNLIQSGLTFLYENLKALLIQEKDQFIKNGHYYVIQNKFYKSKKKEKNFYNSHPDNSPLINNICNKEEYNKIKTTRNNSNHASLDNKINTKNLKSFLELINNKILEKYEANDKHSKSGIYYKTESKNWYRNYEICNNTNEKEKQLKLIKEKLQYYNNNFNKMNMIEQIINFKYWGVCPCTWDEFLKYLDNNTKPILDTPDSKNWDSLGIIIKNYQEFMEIAKQI